MSNLTEGKKALAAGEFDVAEKKLIKALDHRPDDSELWWALMLCKCAFKNDDELVAAVKQKYEIAADEGLSPPPTPFDTSYCKNALKYATSTKRRDFVDKLSGELSDIWEKKRGKALKAPKTNIKARSKKDNLAVAAYSCVGIAAVGGGIAAYAIFAHATWALWTGFGLLIMFIMAAFILRSRLKKSSGSLNAIDVAMIIMFIAMGVAFMVGGLKRDMNSVVILSIAVLVTAILVGGYRIACILNIGGKKKKRKKSDKRGKAKYDRSNAVAAKNKQSKKDNAKREVKDGYKDEDD